MTDEKPADHKIVVSLNSPITPLFLETDAKGGTNVPHSPHKQVIRWTLARELAEGEFVPLSASRPGFEWLSWPPPGVDTFSAPTLVDNTLEITDTNETPDSKGGWIYKLRVKYNDVIYETVLNFDTTLDPSADPDCGEDARLMLKDNPVIINR